MGVPKAETAAETGAVAEGHAAMDKTEQARAAMAKPAETAGPIQPHPAAQVETPLANNLTSPPKPALVA